MEFINIFSESIVVDNYGSSVGLPLSGGNATGGFTIANSLIRTSPYILTIFINDEVLTDPATNQPYPGPSHESFYMANSFGQATLISSTFQAYTLISNTPIPTGPVLTGSPATFYLGTAANLNTAMGAYVFTFTIPVNQTLTANISYNNSVNPTVVDKIFISINNPFLPTVTGDPQFIGLRGQSFQVHGVDGAVYNIISEKDTQVNSRFTFLSQGECPLFKGKPDINCWAHPGSYLGELSFQQRVDTDIVNALVVSGSAKHGFAAVQYNGRLLTIGDSILLNEDFSLNYTSSHAVSIETGHFLFILSNSDYFINQVVKVKVPLSRLNGAHGLLGQTHRARVYNTAVKYIEGSVDDYVVGDDDIFGDSFIYNQFKRVAEQ